MNHQRNTENRFRYAGILRDHRPDASAQLIAAFLESMENKEYSEEPLLNAFDWFWEGWAKSSGAHK